MRDAPEQTKAVFLDRDGVLIQDRHYLSKVEDVELFPETIPALRILSQLKLPLILVTNQSGVGRGLFPIEAVTRIHEHLAQVFAISGIRFTRIFVAPEAPDQPSHGRKPSPNFLLDARNELGIALGDSYMVGDKLIDLECGWNAGVRRSILVKTGYGSRTAASLPSNSLAVVCENLLEAARWIQQDVQSRSQQ